MEVATATMEAHLSAIHESLLQLSATLGRMAVKQDQMLVDWKKRTAAAPLASIATTTPTFVSSRVGEQTTKPSASSLFSAIQVVGAGAPHADAVFAAAMPTRCSTVGPAANVGNDQVVVVSPSCGNVDTDMSAEVLTHVGGLPLFQELELGYVGELWRWHDNKYARNEKRNPGVCNQLNREELPSELLEQHNSGENISSGSKNSDLCAAWVTGENFLARPSSDFVSFCGDSSGDLVMLSLSLPWDPGVFNELGTTVLQSELVKQQTSGQLLITTYPCDSVARCLFTYVVCSNFRRFGMKAVCVHLTHLSAVVWSSVENMLTKLSAAGGLLCNLFLHMITPLQQRHVGWIFPRPPSPAKQLLHAADVQGVMFLHIIMLQQKLGDWCDPGRTFPMCSSFSGIVTTSTCLVFVLQSIICTLGRPHSHGQAAAVPDEIQAVREEFATFFAEPHVLPPQRVERTAAIAAWPRPTSRTELRGIFAFTGYYRKFVEFYGIIAKPLTNWLKKKTFEWTPEAEDAVIRLKQALVSTPILKLPDFSEAVQFLQDRQAHLDRLKVHLAAAQNRMNIQADKHRTEKTFQVGDQVLLKLQPYTQSSVVNRPCPKPAFKYFGPFRIMERIGEVAYKLELPTHSAIHNVFHVSQLKTYTPDFTPVFTDLPHFLMLDVADIAPEQILDRRLVKKGNSAIPQVLIKCAGIPETSATWDEFYVCKTKFLDANCLGTSNFSSGG